MQIENKDQNVGLNIYICIVYTPNLGLAVVIFDWEREQDRFRGSTERARRSIKRVEGSIEGIGGRTEGSRGATR